MSLKKKEKKLQIKKSLAAKYLISYHPKREQLDQWLSGVIKNYVYREEININSDDLFDIEIRHIIDYLLSSDSPKKFHAMTFEEAKRQTSLWDLTLQKRASNFNKNNNLGSKKCFDLLDGWAAYSLHTKEALYREGCDMHNCVGDYYYQINNKTSDIYSIRDSFGKPHITIESKENIIVQAYGKNNKAPKDDYMKYFYDFLEQSNLFVSNYISSFLKLTFVTIGKTNYYIKNKSDYKEKIEEFLRNNPFYKGGGEIIIKDLNIDALNGEFDTVLIENSNIENIENLQVKNLKIIGSTIKSIKKINAVNSIVEYSIVSDSENILSLELFVKESNFDNVNLNKNLSFHAEDQIIERILNSSSKSNIKFTNTILNNTNKLFAELFTLNHCKNIVNSILNSVDSNVETFIVDSYDSKNFKINENFAKSIIIKSAPILQSINNLCSPNLNLNIQNAPLLSEIKDTKVNHLSILKNENIRIIEKCKIKKLEIKTKSEKLLTKRNRISSLVTNNPKLFK